MSGALKVAALAFSDRTPGKIYSCTDAGIFASTDFAAHWNLLSDVPQCDGNGTTGAQIAGNEHPRSTGNLIAQDNSGATSYLWTGTFQNGVKRSTDDGATWPTSALAGEKVRSLVVDPADPDTVYAAIMGKGVYVSRNARGSMTFAALSGTPTSPEELAVIGGKLFVAARQDGIRMYDGAWHPLNTGLATGTAPFWQSIAGYVDSNGQTVLYAGCSQVVGGNSIVKSVTGGATWSSVSGNVALTNLGSGTAWWGADIAYLGLTSTSFVASQLLVDPRDRNTIYLAGRGGAYKSSDGAASWSPIDDGLMVTVNSAVAADPKVPGRAYLANTDWTFFGSQDHLGTVTRSLPSTSGGKGFSIGLDPTTPDGSPSKVYLAVGNRDDATQGEVYSNLDPLSAAQPWVSENLRAVAGKHRVQTVAAGRDGFGAQVVLATVASAGFWRKVNNTWSKITASGSPFQGTNGEPGSFAWVPNTQLVYAYDHGSGVYRSTDAGDTWVKLMSSTASMRGGFVVADPTDPSRIYLSSNGSASGLWRIDNARTATLADANPVQLGGFTTPGAIGVTSDGALLVHTAAGTTTPVATLWRSADAAGPAPAFTAVSDSYYSDASNLVNSLAVSPDDYVYTASTSAGAYVGVPGPAPDPPDLTAPSVPAGLHATVVTPVRVDLSWDASTDNKAVAGYHVYRNGTQVADVTSGTAYSDAVTDAASYEYAVDAYDAAGNVSEKTGPVSVTTPDVTPPSPPANLVAMATAPDEIDLSWDAATDNVAVTGYEVYRDGSWLTTTLGSVTGYQDTNLAAQSSHTYLVRALDAATNRSGSSNEASATTPQTIDVTPPSKPGSLTATVESSSQISLTWLAATDDRGVTSYRVYRDDVLIATLGTELSYVDTGLHDARTYAYRVVAFDAAGNGSDPSDQAAAATLDGTPPTVPTQLAATLTTGGGIALTWSAASDNVAVTAYRLYRDGSQLGTDIAAPTTTYTDTTVLNGRTYGYALSAVDAAGNVSAVSPILPVSTPDTQAPTAPTNLTATAVAGRQIDLSWTAATDNIGVTGNRVYRNSVLLTTLGAVTTYTDLTVLDGASYTYQVESFDAAANAGPKSGSSTATTPDITAPTAPGKPTAVVQGSAVNLTWSAATDNVGVKLYTVKRNGTALAPTTTGLSFFDTTAAQGQTYSYTVTAKDAAGNSGPASTATSISVPDKIAPSAPTNLKGTSVNRKVTLTWTASTDNVGVIGYEVWRGTAKLANVTGTAYTNSGLTSGVKYVYKVRATDAAGNLSAFTTTITVTAQAALPGQEGLTI
ncbi:MAG: hypothetical protein WCB04_00200 [Mycobacteriales bacterium]